MELVIKLADAAMVQLSDPVFLQAWQELYDACPWATVYQSPTFITTWYQAYGKLYQPVLISGQTGAPTLLGLLGLAKARNGNSWVVAGQGLANYKAWIAQPGEGDRFINAALAALRQAYAVPHLSFGYLPPDTPLKWLAENRWLRAGCRTTRHRRALLKPGNSGDNLKRIRKNEKNHINRLGRVGRLHFAHVTDYQEFICLLDQLSVMLDLRKGATLARLPYTENPELKAWLGQLFRHGILHVTVLKAGNHLVSGDISIVGRNNFVHAHLLSHSPFFAKCSPGKIHALMLMETLSASEGLTFDMAPDWAWKDSFTQDYDEVDTLEFYGTYLAIAQQVARSTLRRMLPLLGISRSRVATFINKIGRRHRPLTRRQEAYYACPAAGGKMSALPCGQPPNKNNLADLLAFMPGQRDCNRQVFFSDVQKHLRNGDSFYSSCQKGRLAFLVWVRASTEKVLGPKGPLHIQPPANTVLFHSFYRQPGPGPYGPYLSFLQCAIQDQLAQADLQEIYFVLPEDPLSHVLISQFQLVEAKHMRTAVAHPAASR